MNVIIVYDYGFYNGGTAQVAISSAIALKQTGINVIYFCAVGPIEEEMKKCGIETMCLNKKNILQESKIIRKFFGGIWDFNARKKLRDLLSHYSTSDTVVHFHGWSKALSTSILGVPDIMGFKSCITLHDFFSYCPNGGLYDFKRRLICEKYPMSTQCVLCNCDKRNYANKIWRVLRQIVQNIVLSRIHHITFFYISDLTKQKFKGCYRFINANLVRVDNPVTFPKNDKINRTNADSYLFMGRLSAEKGAELFCKACSTAGVKAIVLGDGPLRTELERRYPTIEFAGWVSSKDKIQYLNRSRALVLPSICYETFGLSVAEMLSVGIPCIVADKTAAAELIKDGENGYLFVSGNIDSLKDAIIRMENHMIENCANKVILDNYSMNRHITTLVTEYKKMLTE